MQSNNQNFQQFYDDTTVKIINTPSISAKSAFFYIQEIGRMGVLKPHRASREKLNSFLLFVVEKGTGSLTYENITYPLKVGQCVFIDCNKIYSQGSSLENPWTISWIHFNGATSKQYYQLFRQDNPPFITLNTSSTYEHLLQLMLYKVQHKNSNTELDCSLHILELLTRLLSEKKATGAINTPMTLKCQQIKDYLDNHYTSTINLDTLSSEFYVSKFYLTREFKKLYGQTIIDYVIAKRITHAKQLLRYSDGSINEIALTCGFHDQSYFNKQFKKMEYITGLEYRRQWQEASKKL